MSITDRMREDWNARAVEDANFYVAFGRRDQDTEEFFETGNDVVRSLRDELKRFPDGADFRTCRALEIGCGPGRLMRPLAQIFGEIHGIDVSDEMIRRAERNLHDLPHAHPHHASGSDLAQFPDESFDFVYSYAVFQHIPSRDVVMNYLWEAKRVLKTGGLIRVQINGLPETAQHYDTWSGVRISAQEVAAFARMAGLQLLAIEGSETQYMWVSLRKLAPGWQQRPGSQTRTLIRRITNTHSAEPVAPVGGRYAAITIWIDGFPDRADLNTLRVALAGHPAMVTFIGPPQRDGITQLNVRFPKGLPTGLLPVEVDWAGRPLCASGLIRTIPPPPQVPKLIDVVDGIDRLSGTVIVTGTIKVTIEDVDHPESLKAWVAGQPVQEIDVFCADPLPPRYEINLSVPSGCRKGPTVLEMQIGKRRLPPVGVDIR